MIVYNKVSLVGSHELVHFYDVAKAQYWCKRGGGTSMGRRGELESTTLSRES